MDGYCWRSCGVQKLPKTEPEIRKMYYDIDTPSGVSKGFQRNAYQLLGNSKFTLVTILLTRMSPLIFPIELQNTRDHSIELHQL